MIDVCQWRASIGLWNYCQAASSRPANGRHSHSFKAAVDSKSGSTTSGEKTSKLPAALSLIVSLLLSLLRYRNLPTKCKLQLKGNCYQVQCTTGVTVTDTNYLQSVVLPGGSSSNLIYNDHYLIVCLRMLLLLSGDIELNPGPITNKLTVSAAVTIFHSSDENGRLIGTGLGVEMADLKQGSSGLIDVFQRWFDAGKDVSWDTLIKLCDDFPRQLSKAKSDLLKYIDQPDISLLTQWLEPLVDWQSFGLLLPGITQQDITKIEEFAIDAEQSKLGLFSKWLQTNPSATWRDVLNALTKREELNLLQTINDQLQVHQCTGGNPKDILRDHSVKLTDAITTNLYRVTDALYAEGLIPLDTKENIQTVTGISDYRKSSQLVTVIQRQLESSLIPKQYLINICRVLKNQQHRTLTDIATSILHQLGQSIPDNVSSHTVLPSPVDDTSNTPATNTRGPENPSVPDASNGAVVGNTRREKIMFNTKEDEEQVLRPLIELSKSFTSLMTKVRRAFDKVASDPELLIDITRWIETKMHWNDKLTNASLNETFNIIHPVYDFIDCNLIVDMSEEFLQDFKFRNDDKLSIVSELKNYKDKADKLRSSVQVKYLNEALKKIYEGFIPDTSNMPVILVKLLNPWHVSDIDGLSLLIHNLLPVGHQQSIMKYITIISGSVIIKYSVLDSTADSLIEYTGGKLQFMRLIGIFSLYINDHPVLQEDENMNFTFELALLEAVTAGNNEAVEFLLQLETVNIDHTNEEGKTALMLASERGNEDIVHSLLSAGANVNIQDSEGWTAVMIASEHNHISIIHMLLQANANPHLKTSDGSNAVMIASGYGNYEVVELLISKGVDYKYQREDGVNALMSACENGHTQIVELLLKEQVDPNVQDNKGVTALMPASADEHSEVVKLLKADQTIPFTSHLVVNTESKKGVVRSKPSRRSLDLPQKIVASGNNEASNIRKRVFSEPQLEYFTSNISSTRGLSVSPDTGSSEYLTGSDISSTRSSPTALL